MFNSSFSNFLTKNHLPHPILILNKNVNENDDFDDETKKQGRNKGVPEFGGGEKIKDFPSLDQLIC